MPVNHPDDPTADALESFDDGAQTLLLGEVTAEAREDSMLGQRIGAYRIERELGRGGMGVVYLAARADDVIQWQTAIKLIKRGMDTDFILRRFHYERQILASLDHPNIARLLDGGTTEDARPYFVMEYIAGQPLFQYCAAQQLSLSDRLTLFMQVCAAVQHAHQQQIIHRDLKPSNILVSTEGQAKLLDFGIAKLLQPDGDATTLPPTATAMRMMTVEYASPEQIRGEAATFLSDVYSLGVILFELLTGRSPYQLSRRAPHELARAICDVEPLRPSTGGMKDESGGLIRKHELSSFIVHPSSLRGNLDNITLKALRKDPVQRYPSVAALRADLQKHLDGQPVSAPLYFSPPPVAKAVEPKQSLRLAVLPLKLLSFAVADNSGESYLSIGLADAIITRLSNVRSLTVRPTSSVLRFGGENAEPFAAGRELNVDFVLDGRIKRAGAQVRVSVQLLDVQQQTTLWAGQFDEPFTDVLSLEDTLSTNVAAALVTNLTTDERPQLAKRGTDNPQAFELYLQGRYHWTTLTPEGYAKSLACNQRAIALDPNYAAPYVGMANYYGWMSATGFLPPQIGMKAAHEAVSKALALDDSLAEAHGMLGWMAMLYDYDLIAAEQHEQRALACNPHNSLVHLWRSLRLLLTGEFSASQASARLVTELDPLSPLAHQQLAFVLYFSRQYEGCVAIYRRLIAAEPRNGLARGSLSWVLCALEQYDEAIQQAEEGAALLGDAPQALQVLALAYAEAGKQQETREVMNRLQTPAAVRCASPYHQGLVHLCLGEIDLAFTMFTEAFDRHDPWAAFLRVEPLLDRVREDERYKKLAQRIRC